MNTFKPQLEELSQTGTASKAIRDACTNITIIEEAAAKQSGAERSKGEAPGFGSRSLGALVVMVAWAVLW